MLPYMTDNVPLKVKSTDVFKGINTSVKVSDGELRHSHNMSARNYPAITVRQGRRKTYDELGRINGLGVYNKLFYTTSDEDGECVLHYGDEQVALGNKHSADTVRSFYAVSDNMLILPDKKLYTPSANSLKDLESCQSADLEGAYAKAKKEVGSHVSEPMDYLGLLYDDKITSAKISNGRYSSYHIALKNLKPGDVVHISMDVKPNDVLYDDRYRNYVASMKEGFYAKISDVVTTTYEILNDGYVTDVTELIFEPGTINTAGYTDISILGIEISVKIPDLAHICTHANRLWATDGNSIRSSALGKPWVWEDYSADAYGTLPTSCYSVEVDSGGEFTGICSFNGSVLAFKQNCIHKLYGTQPENYTLYTQSCTGVELGCDKTLTVINGVLYYKGCDGFYAYSGGVPECISRKLSTTDKALCSSTDGTNYYTIMSGKDGTYLLVYYPDRGIWHKENADDATMLVGDSPALYCAMGHSVVNLCAGEDEVFDWSFELCSHDDSYRYKQYSEIMVKYRLARDGYFTISAEYDDKSHISHITGNYPATPKGYSAAKLPSVRCREMRLVFRGKGDFELLDITEKYRVLSDEK